MSSADIEMQRLVREATSRALGPARSNVRCAGCGDSTSDAYLFDAPDGKLYVCPTCNHDPHMWDSAEELFLGPNKPKGE